MELCHQAAALSAAPVDHFISLRRLSFVRADFFKTDLSEATVVTLFLSPNINARLQPKLRRELRPGARIVSHRFPMPPDWKPERDLAVSGTHVFLWTIR